MKFYPYKKEDGKSFRHAEGGVQKVLCGLNKRACGFGHT